MKIFHRKVIRGSVSIGGRLLSLPKGVSDGDIVKICEDGKGFYLVFDLLHKASHQSESSTYGLSACEFHNLMCTGHKGNSHRQMGNLKVW